MPKNFLKIIATSQKEAVLVKIAALLNPFALSMDRIIEAKQLASGHDVKEKKLLDRIFHSYREALNDPLNSIRVEKLTADLKQLLL